MAPSTPVILGYGTNVHAGTTLARIRENLQTHAVAVKRRVSPGAPMGVGLWLPFEAAAELMEGEGVRRFRDWLGERGLFAYTLNGFPLEDFHRPVVKHAVYEPDWTQARRYDYTLALATILAELLPEGATEGSISTLPLGWPGRLGADAAGSDARARLAGRRLTDLVHQLARIELNTGRCIHVDLEPEPGCVIDSAAGMVRYFEDYLWGTADEVSVRGYLRVCHDVCHSAVMFEGQQEAVAAYRRAGLAVGKVQLSSAIDVSFDEMDAPRREEAVAALRGFDEERYLHQTVIQTGDGATAFHEDLPAALAAHPKPDGRWRVHFHVPVDRATLGPLRTTHEQIPALLAALRTLPAELAPRHLEVETYAWDVLPGALRPTELAEGIAAELRWVGEVMA